MTTAPVTHGYSEELLMSTAQLADRFTDLPLQEMLEYLEDLKLRAENALKRQDVTTGHAYFRVMNAVFVQILRDPHLKRGVRIYYNREDRNYSIEPRGRCAFTAMKYGQPRQRINIPRCAIENRLEWSDVRSDLYAAPVRAKSPREFGEKRHSSQQRRVTTVKRSKKRRRQPAFAH